MIVYSSNKVDFRKDVSQNLIEKKILTAFQYQLGQGTSQKEINSWKNSLMYMSNILEDESIPNDSGIAIEYMLPRSSKRIDFIISGKSSDKQDSIVIVELKQWNQVEITNQESIVKSFVGGALRELPHPSYQAASYADFLEDFNEYISTQNIIIKPCSYLHNLESDVVIRDAFYQKDLDRSPVFIRSEAEKLSQFIKNHIRYGDDDGLMFKIDSGRIKPTKKLADSFASMLSGNKEFIMIDDQKVVYEKTLNLSKVSSSKEKNVLIVNGGPGTGKSVVAINLLVRLIQDLKNVQYVSKNAAPREVFSSKLTGSMSKSRYKSLFVGSGGFTNTERNLFDALIVDEAHRLNEKSGLYSNLGENQIKEIINSAKLSVFFLDEDQRIAFNDIGSKEEIYRWAKKLKANVIELDLSSQFRCNGSDGYLAWLDNVLEIRETANFSMKELDYDFKVFDNALAMHSEITKKNSEEATTARTVAGYCWDWKSSNDGNLYDIEIGDLKMKWNLKAHGSSWIINPNSITEAGCIHTCQGLEVDYVGVIIGSDFTVKSGKVITDGHSRPSRDKTIKGFRSLYRENPANAYEKADKIIKNTYKTLMTRGMRGCYIYCVDAETRDYFKKALQR